MTTCKVFLKATNFNYRLDTDDAPEKIKNIPVESLRLEHIAEDSEGALYWYFYGTRLYKQVKAKRQERTMFVLQVP